MRPMNSKEFNAHTALTTTARLRLTPTQTQAAYHRRALKEQAEAHGRMLGRLFALEIIGFAVIIAIELLK